MNLRRVTEKYAKPSVRALLQYATHEGKPEVWITFRKKDGTGEHSGTVATNPEYVKVHHEWRWIPIALPKDERRPSLLQRIGKLLGGGE